MAQVVTPGQARHEAPRLVSQVVGRLKEDRKISETSEDIQQTPAELVPCRKFHLDLIRVDEARVDDDS